MYKLYDSEREAGWASFQTATGILLPNPILKSGTIIANSSKVVSKVNSQLLLESQSARLLRIAENPQLKRMINELWRDGAKFGDGSTAAMIKIEKAEGVITSASGSHMQKAENALVNLRKLLNGNYGTLSESDRNVIFEIIENLTNGTGVIWKH